MRTRSGFQKARNKLEHVIHQIGYRCVLPVIHALHIRNCTDNKFAETHSSKHRLSRLSPHHPQYTDDTKRVEVNIEETVLTSLTSRSIDFRAAFFNVSPISVFVWRPRRVIFSLTLGSGA